MSQERNEKLDKLFEGFEFDKEQAETVIKNAIQHLVDKYPWHINSKFKIELSHMWCANGAIGDITKVKIKTSLI